MTTRQTESGETDAEDGADPPATRKQRSLSADETFALLGNQRRRTALRALDEHGPELTQGELAEYVAAHEHGVRREDVTSVQRKRVYISLYQNHLPRFDDAGVVAYDADRGHVALSPPSEALFAHLDGVADRPDRTTLLALIGVNAIVVASLVFPVAPASLVVLVSLVLFAATAVHVR